MSCISKFLERIMGRRKPKPRPKPVPQPIPNPTPAPVTPAFVDNFTNLDNWIISTWTAPMDGKFQADRVSINTGMLCLALTQMPNPDGTFTSVGSEVRCKQLMGFGTYEFVVRASSTANLPDSIGHPVSGSITGMFNFINDSQTEIDFEVEGNSRHNLIQFTNWNTRTKQQSSVSQLNPAPHTKFYRYKFVWSAEKIDFYVDDILINTHTQNIPTTPAFVMFNHWGTNNPNWGGPGTTGIRYMWVKSFSFTPA
jgi:endo-1,3-1,4-beta-glycanase ExoK